MIPSVLFGIIDATDTAPHNSMILGFRISIWESRYSRHAAFSSGSGLRLCGGRHFIVLQMYIFSFLEKPTHSKILSKSWPERPTNGEPCKSSCSPGASPISIIRELGTPPEKTVLVLLL